MIAALKALWNALTRRLRGVLGCRVPDGLEHKALVQVMLQNLDWGLYMAAWRAVHDSVWRNLSFSTQQAAGFWCGDLHEAVFSDPPHPALQDFLRSLGKDGVGRK